MIRHLSGEERTQYNQFQDDGTLVEGRLKECFRQFSKAWENVDDGIGDGPTLPETGIAVPPGHATYFEGCVFHSGEELTKAVYNKLEGDKCSYKLFILYQPVEDTTELETDYQFRRLELYQSIYGWESSLFRRQYLYEKIKTCVVNALNGFKAPTYESLLSKGEKPFFNNVKRKWVGCFFFTLLYSKLYYRRYLAMVMARERKRCCHCLVL
jgi:hypothetical protein